MPHFYIFSPLHQVDNHETFTHPEEEAALKDAWARVDKYEKQGVQRRSIFDSEILPTLVMGLCIFVGIGVVLSAILGF